MHGVGERATQSQGVHRVLAEGASHVVGRLLAAHELGLLSGVVQAGQHGEGVEQGLVAPGQRRAVVRLEVVQPDGLCGHQLERVLDDERVALGLAHLLVDLGRDVVVVLLVAVGLAPSLGVGRGDHAVVHPDAHELGAAVGALGLGDLVLVVREHQVEAAAVDVDLLAQRSSSHGGALDVPARAAWAPGTRPARLAGSGRLPQGEVRGVALAVVGVSALQLVDVLAGEGAVPGEGADVEPHRAVDHVGVVALDELGDHAADRVEGVADAGLGVGPGQAQVVHVLVEGRDVAVGQREGLDALVGGLGQDLVVDVGDVADEVHGPAAVTQVPGQRRVHDHRAGVAHVAVVVDRHAALVDRQRVGCDRDDVFDLADEGVVQAQWRRGHGRFLRPANYADRAVGASGGEPE